MAAAAQMLHGPAHITYVFLGIYILYTVLFCTYVQRDSGFIWADSTLDPIVVGFVRNGRNSDVDWW